MTSELGQSGDLPPAGVAPVTDVDGDQLEAGVSNDLARDAIRILARLVAFDTTSSASNLPLISFVEDFLGGFGVRCRRLTSSSGAKANLLATIGPLEVAGIVLSGHTDVVPVTGQQWTSDPFILARRGDRLYGRGASDMKAFLALALAIAPRLAATPLRQPVHLAFSYDEEIGCLGAPDLIEALLRDLPRPVAAIIGEPSNMRVVNSHKGIHLYEVVVRGRAAHSSQVHRGVSANMVAIELLSELARIADVECRDHRDDSFDPPWSTLTVGLINGGTAANILAAECRFTFDLRVVPGRKVSEVLAPFWRTVDGIRTKFGPQGAEVVVNQVAGVPALSAEPGCEAEQWAARLSGSNAPGSAVAYGAEAGLFEAAGISAVICGPGSILQAHRPDEFIEIEQIEAGARFMSRLVEAVRST